MLHILIITATMLLTTVLPAAPLLPAKLNVRRDCAVHLSLQSEAASEEIEFSLSEHREVSFNGGRWLITPRVQERKDAVDFEFRVQLLDGFAPKTVVRLDFDFRGYDDAWLLLPGAVYNGNRFRVLPMSYPPLMSDPQYFTPDPPITITDLPRLNPDEGICKLEQTTGDLATPAMGFFSAKRKKAVWLLTEQGTAFGNSGLTVEQTSDGRFTLSITAPALRERRQTMAAQVPSDDRAPDWQAGNEITLRARLDLQSARRLQELFDRFVEIRKDLNRSERVHGLPFSAAFDIIEKKYNEQNWEESRGYYSVGMRESINQDWQLGWVGGGMATQALLLRGDSLSQARARRNLDVILTKTQAASGFFYGIGDGTHWWGDGFDQPHPHNMHMVRKSADALYFFCKQVMLLQQRGEPVPQPWLDALRRLADAFVRLWEENGQFGQFVDVETGKLLVGGSTSGAMAPGGLALAAQVFGDERYLRVARQSAELFYRRDLRNGLTTGGPGEILQAPDSESAFALLESLVTLYEVSKKPKYRDWAAESARQCATWVVSYDYHFPENSLFGRLGMRSTGAVIANAQNKHAAPGICTLSGNSLLRLYRATGDTFYIDLLRDMAHNITQYLSREDRPVGDMPAGWMNERVNLSDWEGKGMIGGIFRGSTWAEVACLLTAAEVPSLYVRRSERFNYFVFDHLQVEVVSSFAAQRTLRLTNPTGFAAEYKILIEDYQDAKKPLDPNYPLKMMTVKLAPGESVSLKITPRGVSIDGEKEPISPLYFRTRNFSRNHPRVEPGVWWVRDDSYVRALNSVNCHVKWASHNRPFAKSTRFGLAVRYGADFLRPTDSANFFFVPIPYLDAGPEVVIKDHLYFSTAVGNIGFPATLMEPFYMMILTYADFRIGVQKKISSNMDLTFSYTCRYFPLGLWGFEEIDGAAAHNISLGFA